MRVFSLIRSNFNLVPVEVELVLVPGLPQIQILGLPDANIRESAARIKSALRAQKFRFPKAQRVLVNLKPNHLRKTSHGLDLAIAAALLFELGAVPCPKRELIFYGELGLTGDIHIPDDIADFVPASDHAEVVSGAGPQRSDLRLLQLHTLRDLQHLGQLETRTAHLFTPARPKLENLRFAKEAAEAMMVVALGEHGTLLAGPPGTGKTTWASQVHAVISAPTAQAFRVSRQIARHFCADLEWRPFISPHHSATALAMVGGGVPPFPGQITRAHGGVLLLDELLQFGREIHEALREPVEAGRLTVVRAGQSCEFPADILLIATTNLCQCGRYLPNKRNSCSCPTFLRNAYMRRLSGPLLDRFQILLWTSSWLKGGAEVSLPAIAARVAKAREFAQETRNQSVPNAKLGDEFWRSLDPFATEHFVPQGLSSRRRRLACARVARSVADLALSEKIEPWHWQKAAEMSALPFLHF